MEITEQLEDTAPVEVTPTETLEDVTPADRCDVCRVAAAYVRVRTGYGDILYCGHHFSEREYNIASQGFKVRDERERAALGPRDIKMEERDYGKNNRRRLA